MGFALAGWGDIIGPSWQRTGFGMSLLILGISLGLGSLILAALGRGLALLERMANAVAPMKTVRTIQGDDATLTASSFSGGH